MLRNAGGQRISRELLAPPALPNTAGLTVTQAPATKAKKSINFATYVAWLLYSQDMKSKSVGWEPIRALACSYAAARCCLCNIM